MQQVSDDPTPPGTGRRPAPTGHHWRWWRRTAAVLLFAVVLEYLVLPRIAGTRRTLDLLVHVRWYWLVLGVLLEVVSLLNWSKLTDALLPAPGYWWTLRSDVTALGVSHVVPGGSAAATALRFRLLREGGAGSADLAVALTAESVGSALVLMTIWAVSLLASMAFAKVGTVYLLLAAAAVVVVAGAVLAAWSVARHPERAGSMARRAATLAPRRFRERVARFLADAAREIVALLADKQGLASSGAWAVGNWLFDAAALWVFLLAFGARPDPVAVLVAYGAANILAVIPVSPGGLGVVEGVLIPSLVGFGTTGGVAVLAVVSWRLVEFWLPIPVSGLSYLSLRLTAWSRRRHRFTPEVPSSVA